MNKLKIALVTINQPSSGTFQQALPIPSIISNFQVPLNHQQVIPSQMIPHINPNTYPINNPINGKINQMNRTSWSIEILDNLSQSSNLTKPILNLNKYISRLGIQE